VVIAAYQLNWSNLYPILSPSLLLFFLISFLVALVLAFLSRHVMHIEFMEIACGRYNAQVCLVVIFGVIIEFLNAKKIPLVAVLMSDATFDYRQFGLPFLHVLIVTFSSFAAVLLFHELVSKFRWRELFFYLVYLGIAVLIMNRGMFLMIVVASLFVGLLKWDTGRIWMITGFFVAILFYGFGILGNLRHAHTIKSDLMIKMSKASPAFQHSIMPKPYIWGYVYLTSPLANFQKTLDKADPGLRWMRWKHFLNFELLPDFISKRTASWLDIKRIDPPQITDWLTASTMYSRSFLFLGWTGVVLMFLFFAVTTIGYRKILGARSRYSVTGFALLNTVIVFNSFDNMYAFTGLIFQLAYPVTFIIAERTFKRPLI
jgi:hypothetical protein